MGGLVVVKVRHKEQTRELLAVGGCSFGPMAVMCPPFPRSLMCPLCTTASFVTGKKKKRTHTRSEHKEQEPATSRSAVIEALLRHRVAFRTCQKEVAPNGVRLCISEPPSRAEAAEYLSVAANDIATRTNGEAHQRLDANGHPWQKPPRMHLCNVSWETWWTDGDRVAVVAFSCHWEG